MLGLCNFKLISSKTVRSYIHSIVKIDLTYSSSSHTKVLRCALGVLPGGSRYPLCPFVTGVHHTQRCAQQESKCFRLSVSAFNLLPFTDCWLFDWIVTVQVHQSPRFRHLYGRHEMWWKIRDLLFINSSILLCFPRAIYKSNKTTKPAQLKVQLPQLVLYFQNSQLLRLISVNSFI